MPKRGLIGKEPADTYLEILLEEANSRNLSRLILNNIKRFQRCLNVLRTVEDKEFKETCSWMFCEKFLMNIQRQEIPQTIKSVTQNVIKTSYRKFLRETKCQK